MANKLRPKKVSSALENELSNIIIRDLEFDGALVTILNIDTSDDLLKANVKLGIIPYEKELEVYKELNKHRKEIQHKLLKRMRIRHIPKLHFEIVQEI